MTLENLKGLGEANHTKLFVLIFEVGVYSFQTRHNFFWYEATLNFGDGRRLRYIFILVI